MADIYPDDLIAIFRKALADEWGYIWGTAGVQWTKAKQAALEKTTDSDRAQGRKYGSKWIGHMVADCSGLFSYAFKQLGGSIYHGSDTMYRKYCVNKGELKNGKRTDAGALKPGTAVFVWNGKKYSHVGLFTGDGTVIEAMGTLNGVTTSKISDSKWTNWGELTGVDYSGVSPEPHPEPEPVPAGYAEVIGKRVALREDPSTRATIIMRIDTGELVKLEPEPDAWDYVSYKGRKGWMMKEFLKEGESK